MTKALKPYPEHLTFHEKLQLYLFDEASKIPEYHKFTPTELVIKERYSKIFTYWITKPTLSDKQIIHFIMHELHMGKTQAIKDAASVKLLLGNVRNANKEWYRYKVESMLNRAYEIAEKDGNALAMIAAADKLGKYTQLDKEDPMKIPYEEIVPQNFEITGDVTVLGIEPIENLEEKQRKMREKYGGTLIEEAQVVNEEEQ